MRPYPILALACAALAGCAGTPRHASPADLVIRDVTIVDVVAGRLLPAQDVVVAAGRVTAIGPTGRMGAAADRVVEGGGGYLIPGLWDMHVHWYDEATLPIFLAHGVTGVRQMRGYASMSASRARGLEGTVGSPRVYLASPLVDGPRPATPPALKAADAASARAIVALAARSSADFLKLYDQIPRDAYFALIEEAERLNVRVEGHVPIAVSWQEAAERGVQRSAEHLHSMPIWTAHDVDALHQRWLVYHERLDYHAFDAARRQESAGILTDAYEHQDPQRQAALLRALAEARMWQVPTCVLWRARGDSPEVFLADPRMRFAPEWMRDFWTTWWPSDAPEAVAADFAVNARRDAFCLDRVRAMHAAGVPLLAGSDTIMPGVFPGSSLHEELALMVGAGLSPLDALRTATTGPAAFMERDDIGRIAPGALADLVLLEADPLLDIDNTTRITGVAIGGVWLDSPALHAALDHAAAVTAAPVVAAEMARVLAADGLDAAMAYYETQCPAPPNQANCTGWNVAWGVGGALGQHADAARMPEFLAWVEGTFHSDADALDALASQLADRGDSTGALRVVRRILELAPGDLQTMELEASLRAASGWVAPAVLALPASTANAVVNPPAGTTAEQRPLVAKVEHFLASAPDAERLFLFFQDTLELAAVGPTERGVSGTSGAPPPILDMHLHARTAAFYGPPPLPICAPVERMPRWDQRQPLWEDESAPPLCSDPLLSPLTDADLLQQTLATMERHNVIGVLGGSPELVRAWMAAAPGRFIPGLDVRFDRETGEAFAPMPPGAPRRSLPVDEIRRLYASGAFQVLAEVTNQYAGIAPDDPRLAPLWAMAEELDIPVGIHIGGAEPGTPYTGSPAFRARLQSALTLEEVLVRHPRLRIYIMHAGYPLLEDLLALLFTYPQVYVEPSMAINVERRPAFYRFLRGIVEAGYADRVMFGSDQILWPGLIDAAVRSIEEAPFLTPEQKRDIFYNNAARFLRLTPEEIARHHGSATIE